ncbi:adenosylmethionine--8-amino-7-oxononanoate transaminase [uncultured Desulfovibrio sp.]|uniref:adenosylmethionine--8-amino-7-oxononanoate transaminase n=1 Tax=uncultured Desulfovibrio sp. TaxID=167968 RepID=UPI002805844C|nr:adenosylmethionine--8-amino-7-oxononanoate transaminase [uncultured Desulfovibrio sp.]
MSCPDGIRPLRAVFVAGTGTDVGKTVVTAALLRALRGLGVAAQAVKPVQTGVPAGAGARRAGTHGLPLMGDAAACAAAVADMATGSPLPPAAVLRIFALPASPHFAAAAEGACLDAAGLAADIRGHWARSSPPADLLLLEAAGGLLAPLNAREAMLDLMAAVGAPVILTVRNELGALNHALLSLAALRRQGLALAALVLVEPPPEAREASGRAILDENSRYLRERSGADWPDAVMVRLPHAETLGPEGWSLLAEQLLPLAHFLRGRLAGGLSHTPAEEMEDRDHAALWHPYASATHLPPLETASRSHDNRIVLADGRELVDGMSSWWAAVHGYNHPRLLAALRAQSDRMPHVMFGGLTHAPAVTLGERLLAAMPEGLERLFFADSGSVAVEVALKMALQCQQGRGERRRTRFLAPRGGYHGDTLGAMSVCDPVTGMHSLFAGLLPEQLFMERPSCRFDAPFAPACLEDARRVLAERGDEIAAVILEPVVQGAGGMWFYHPDYLRGLAELCRGAGALLIFDEIATGFGRTGRFFAAEWAGVRPDILCCGKALTGGVLSLAATACTAAVAGDICRDGRVFMHGPTFMGNPLACAVAGASLDILEENRWQSQVERLERLLARGLEPCRQFPDVADVRVLGAIGVVEMTAPVNGAALQRFFVERGVWIRPFGRLIYLMPPYITPEEDVARLCAAVASAVEVGVWRVRG